ncbi:MAG: hypothetical protein L0J71_04295, partial [Bifidobacterium crudilactis]|nr:hypothetical protein [Bifidobacterium crudilactis]
LRIPGSEQMPMLTCNSHPSHIPPWTPCVSGGGRSQSRIPSGMSSPPRSAVTEKAMANGTRVS